MQGLEPYMQLSEASPWASAMTIVREPKFNCTTECVPSVGIPCIHHKHCLSSLGVQCVPSQAKRTFPTYWP